MIIQFILWFILLLALLWTWRRGRQGALRRSEVFVWSVVWIGIAFIIWRPEVTNLLANVVGVGRGADLMLYAAVIVLLLLVFHLHIAHDRLERQLTELVRREALQEMDQK